MEGLGFWKPTELVDATLPPEATRWQRAGARLHFLPLEAGSIVAVRGLRVTSPSCTLLHGARIWDRNAFVCLADSALHQQLLDEQTRAQLGEELRRLGLPRASQWLDLADGRSESPSETTVRLTLIDAGLAPDDLQYEVFTASGFLVARLDMVWIRNGRIVGLEVDSRWHDKVRPLYKDRDKHNALRGMKLDIRQVTAWDAHRRPKYVVHQVAQALGMS